MRTPIETRPRIITEQIQEETIVRYFVQLVSTRKIYEVDLDQYNIFVYNPYYIAIKLPWVIAGNKNTDTFNGKVRLGALDKNNNIIKYYNTKLPGLNRKLSNPLEYFVGTNNNIIVSNVPTSTNPTSTNPTVTPTSSIAPTEIQADYWWRADSGLSTSGWTAYNGGIDFTFTNVSTADSTNGAVFNGETGFGLTPNLVSNITAKHVFLRIENFVTNTRDSMLGGTQNNIHEIGFVDSGFWFVVDITNTGTLRYAARTTTNIAPSNLIWFDFTNASNVRVYLEDGVSPTATLSTYAGTFTNNFIWQSGYGIYLARRKEVSGGQGFTRMDVKELAIFTSSLSTEQAKEFRTEMLNRYPI